MNIDFVLSAHGVNSRKSEFDSIVYQTVQNLTATSSPDGLKIILSWLNPTNSEHTKTEIYVSDVDLSNVSRDHCIANATKIVDSKTLTTYEHSVSKNKLYYYKCFCLHTAFGIEKISNGISVSSLAKDTLPPNPITNFIVTKERNESVSLSWNNPTDGDFSKTKIVYKIGSYPNGINDGTVAYDGSSTSLTLTGLTNDIDHYFRAFTFDTSGNINTSSSMQVKAIPSNLLIYGVRINKTNSNPETSVTYTDEAIGMIGGSSDWDNIYPFNQIKPCLFKEGQVNYYLNPNDFTKKVDGSTADITSGADGDVMIEFPKVWWKITSNSEEVRIQFSNKRIDDSWKCLAHTKGTVEKDKVYIGAYFGNTVSSKLRSLSGKAPTVYQTIGVFRTQAQANGTGYQQMGYYQLLMLQVLYLIRYKSLNSQAALGRGYVDDNTSAIKTGGTNLKGMYFGETTGKQQIKFAGIEDFWGNCCQWIDGLYSDSNRNILIANQNFNDNASGYSNFGQGSTSNLNGYISDIQGGTETGFIIKSTNGSESTYYSDRSHLLASHQYFFGGYWLAASIAGPFMLQGSSSSSNSFDYTSARLCYV